VLTIISRRIPRFFAEARFHIGDDDYYLYSRFGQYLARSIEANRVPAKRLSRFHCPEQMARVSARDPAVRRMLVSGPLEYIVDAPKLTRWRAELSAVAQGYLESLCE